MSKAYFDPRHDFVLQGVELLVDQIPVPLFVKSLTMQAFHRLNLQAMLMTKLSPYLSPEILDFCKGDTNNILKSMVQEKEIKSDMIVDKNFFPSYHALPDSNPILPPKPIKSSPPSNPPSRSVIEKVTKFWLTAFPIIGESIKYVLKFLQLWKRKNGNVTQKEWIDFALKGVCLAGGAMIGYQFAEAGTGFLSKVPYLSAGVVGGLAVYKTIKYLFSDEEESFWKVVIVSIFKDLMEDFLMPNAFINGVFDLKKHYLKTLDDTVEKYKKKLADQAASRK